MRLDHIHLGRLHPSIGQRLADHPLLSHTAGRRQPPADPALVTANPHHRQHRMPMALRI